MKNPTVGKHEAEDLRKQIEKVLRGLGNPEPPLDLRDVRELLKLDLRYYSSTDTGFLQETVSRLQIAGRQILLRPSLLLEVVRKAKLSALWVPDHQRILIDQDVPQLKHRWLEGHEIGHSLAPWHQRFLFGDDSESLSQACEATLECEANYACGQLLFLLNRFADEANSLPASFESVKKLRKIFGNTWTSTLWRFVEEAHLDKNMLAIVSQHPHRPHADFDHANPCKYFIESPGFRERFSASNPKAIFDIIKGYSNNARGGPLGATQVQLVDNNGDRHVFLFESHFNTYECLTLAVHVRPSSIIVPGI